MTLGCGEARAVHPGRRYLDWTVADPERRPLEVVRRIRYELYHHVCSRLDTLEPHDDRSTPIDMENEW